MCGIAGFVTHGADRNLVIPMTDALRHRGPDQSGIWSDPNCVLGHRRLSIIDLSEAGRQPLSNEDGTIWITFNGEIYNFQQLRKELEGVGHKFRTHTDTECIVHGYEQWGADCVRHLRGMFAFAIWDQRRKRLFAARDRVGKKPFFYRHENGVFVFASELQGLLAYPGTPREFDVNTLDAFMSYGYVPAPQTAFKHIYKLPPANTLTLDFSTAGSAPKIERYWRLEYAPKLQITEAEAAEVLREKMKEAVRLRMISDVPLGAFLSGGIDSSIVVGLMAQLSSRPVKTFSIGFRNSAYDELEHARRIAKLWSTDHFEFVVEPDALSILPLLVRHYGEPYGDSSAIPTFHVARLTRSSVTVALNGDGGDESFAGYERYMGNVLAERLQRLPGATSWMRAASSLLPDSLDPKNRLRQAKRFLTVASWPMYRRYCHWLSYFGEAAKEEIYTPEVFQKIGMDAVHWIERLFAHGNGVGPLDAAMRVDIESYLPYDLLVKVDIAAMANSLEGRSPFLDHEVIEFAASLPPELKLGAGKSKYLLRQAFPDLLPKQNVNRRKMGFGVPVGEWFRGPLREMLCDTILSQRALRRGYFQPSKIQQLVNDHTNGRADHSYRLWNLLMLELWHQLVLESVHAAHAC